MLFLFRIHFNKKARLEKKKMKKLSKKVPRLKRKKYVKTHCTTTYNRGPDVLTPMKLWSIIYIALRVENEKMYLSDMLR